ncbi:hypothetical protein ACQYRI_08445 [Salmonella enterica]
MPMALQAPLSISPETKFAHSTSSSVVDKHSAAVKALAGINNNDNNSSFIHSEYYSSPEKSSFIGSFRNWWSGKGDKADEELQSVFTSGRQKSQQAEYEKFVLQNPRKPSSQQQSSLSLKGKMGLALGAVALGGAGFLAGRYSADNAATRCGDSITLGAPEPNIMYPCEPKIDTLQARPYNFYQQSYLAERGAMETQYLTTNLQRFGVNVTSSSLSELKAINKNHYEYLSGTLKNTLEIVDAAMVAVLKASNLHNVIRPHIEDYNDLALLSYLYAKNSTEGGFDYTQYEQIKEQFEQEVLEEINGPFIAEINGPRPAVNDLLLALGKMRIYLARSCENHDDDCINFITGFKTQEAYDFEAREGLTPLYMTTGNNALLKFGYDKLDIALTDDFFKLCTVDATHAIIYGLLHYFTDTTDLFEIKRDQTCEHLPASAANESLHQQLEGAEKRLAGLKNNIDELLDANWSRMSRILNDTLHDIPGFSDTSSTEEKKNLFSVYYKNSASFRHNVNSHVTDYFATLILALASQQMKKDDNIPLSPIEYLKDS